MQKISRFMSVFCFLFSFFFIHRLWAHGDHHISEKILINWLGGLHLIFLHFPITFIFTTAIIEVLRIWYDYSIFNYTSRFMILAAALTGIPTALFGFILGWGTIYEGELLNFYQWHRLLGSLTVLLTIFTAFLKEKSLRDNHFGFWYYSCLFCLFISMNLTGLFGGILTFGWEMIWPFTMN